MSSVNTKHAGTDDPEIDPLWLGQGALVDADILKEAARLHALYVEQLGAQASLLAGHVPQALLSLFRHTPYAAGEPNAQPRP